ncbi:hypothetical protein [Archangium violaceum]|uniref:Uncharacterized protein n=1 Tax=Archangium violaceum Cb vi76 TaxID=1406225 RepID=A0A084SQR2_9BACT|nr:hypothetical protein [Archangium violaceum]KFA90797.1 hypothetical protein Q664_26125 [Archangium violaceum Cb vi76]
MRVIIEAPLLVSAQQARYPLALLELFNLCLDQDCHTLEVEPLDAPELKRWTDTLTPAQQKEIEFILDASAERQLRDPPASVVRVADVEEARWEGTVPRLPLRGAVALLRKPLRVLIEGVHDEHFLHAIVPHFYRARFEDWSKREMLKLEHRGGLQNLGHALEQECQARERRLRLFVMFDSDARKRGEPHSESRKVARFCKRNALAHHQLERRAIDNYIPEPAIERWLKQKHPREFDGRWLPRLQAFRLLSDEQRHHYNMKKGFRGDREGAGLADIFDRFLSTKPGQAAHLEEGFSPAVAETFLERIPDAWLAQDGQAPELMELFEKLLRAA